MTEHTEDIYLNEDGLDDVIRDKSREESNDNSEESGASRENLIDDSMKVYLKEMGPYPPAYEGE